MNAKGFLNLNEKTVQFLNIIFFKESRGTLKRQNKVKVKKIFTLYPNMHGF